MPSQMLTFAVPDKLLARIRERAEQANHSLEAEVVQLLTEAFGAEDAMLDDAEVTSVGFDLLDESALRDQGREAR